MKIAAIIYTRLGSKRLKNKALRKINNKILLEIIIDRTKLIKNINEIIVATSNQQEDKKIVKIAKKNNVKYFCGNINNLIKRSVDCCNQFNIDAVVRICGDRPLFDLHLINKAINMYKKNSNSFDLISSEVGFKSIPGLVTELISYGALLKLTKQKLSKYHLEHLTSYFYLKHNDYNIKKLKSKYVSNGISLTVDIMEDIDRISYILSSNYPKLYLETDKNILKAKEWYRNQLK